MKNLAVIPARGGSKRVPKKNIRPFFGEPMIGRAIKLAQQTKLFDSIIVSTDCEETAAVARSYGASIPFMRPASLSDDFVGTAPVISHAISLLETNNQTFDYVCCLYPCCPLLLPEDLIQGHDEIIKTDASFLYPIVEYAHPIQRSFRIDGSRLISSVFPEHEQSRTQDLEKTYHDAGQFYWGSAQSWVKNNRIFSNSIGILMPAWRVADIDTEEDWKRAEALFKTTLF